MEGNCPLGQGMYWLGEGEGGRGVPKYCRDHCEDLADRALNTQAPEIDTFSHDCHEQSPCTHAIEPQDYSLQRIGAAKRGYGVLNVCATTGAELYSENVSFVCPNN